MKRIRSLLVIAVLALLCGPVPGTTAEAGRKTTVGDLQPRFAEWLKLVSCLIQPVEKEVFLHLDNDRERDVFIEMFWKQRDPTPGTPANEYKDEIAERFKYVNRTFGRSTVREGWQTDMGRFYMILGPPTGIEKFETSSFIVPCQAWTYYGDGSGDLPNLFVLLFFQKGGAGDFKLYDATADGPAALLVNKDGLQTLTGEELYRKIYQMAPTLADLSISMVPGDIYSEYSPSPRNNMILAEIIRSPGKKINNPSYATHFLDYRGIVSTEYMTNFVESQAATALIIDPLTGARFLHFSLAPASVSLDFYEPKRRYFCSFQVNVSLRVGELVVFQYTRDFPVYIDEKDVDRVRANGLAIEDSFPVAPGRYKMSVLLLNSVGKEFSLIEKDLEVPADRKTPRLDGPYLGYGTGTYAADAHIPFTFEGRKLIVDPRKTFSAADELVVFFDLENLSEGLRRGGQVLMDIRRLDPAKEAGRAVRRTTIKLDELAAGAGATVSRTVPVKELVPDYYEIKLTLVDPDGTTLDEVRDNFVVSSAAVMGHPIAKAKAVAQASRFLYLYMLAEQEDKLGETAGAAAYYERALKMGPGYPEGVLNYVDFLTRSGDYDRALELADRLKSDKDRRFEYLLARGRALAGKGLYGEALPGLEEANGIYNSDTRVLNALGECYLKTGRKDKALEAWKSSLKMAPEQPEINRLAAEAEKDK